MRVENILHFTGKHVRKDIGQCWKAPQKNIYLTQQGHQKGHHGCHKCYCFNR
jgi:hypothetical protein